MKKDNNGISENPMYHDTWTLLKKYRDVVWSLELSVQKLRRQFQIEYGSSIEEFLESIYLAGVDFADSGIEEHAQSIERSHTVILTEPCLVYLMLFDRTCSMINNSHFSSVSTLISTGVYSRRILRRTNCGAYLWMACLIILSSSYSLNT